MIQPLLAAHPSEGARAREAKGQVRLRRARRGWAATHPRLREHRDQAEAAIAFLPASNAFGMMRDIQLRLDELGYLERFEMVNSVYDSIQLHPLKEEAEEAIRLVQPVMEARSEKMIYAIVPDGLSVEAEGSVGESIAEMRTI